MDSYRGGAVVAAHPFRWGQPFEDILQEEKPELDGLELMTSHMDSDCRRRAAEVQRNIAVAAAYYEDKLLARPRQLHYAGSQKLEEFSSLLADPELSVIDMVPSTGLGATTALGPVSLAGISGALAGA